MSKHILRGLLLLSPFLFTSCVDFDSQTCSFRYDAASDQLRIFQVYERIFAEGNEGVLTGTEQTQITSFTEGERTFFFGNWIFEYSRKEAESRIADLKTQIDEAEAEQIELLRPERDLLTVLLESVKVTNGDFYLNKKGELCGYQTVTVSNVSKLIDVANQGANRAVLSLEAGKWAEKIRQFAKVDGKWITLEGNKLTIQFPTENVEDTKAEMAKWTAGGKPAFAGVVSYDEPFVKMTFGEKDAASTSFHVDNRAEGKYNTLVLEHVREDHEVIGMLNVDRLRDNFLSAEPARNPAD